jgi:hypothetical protein
MTRLDFPSPADWKLAISCRLARRRRDILRLVGQGGGGIPCYLLTFNAKHLAVSYDAGYISIWSIPEMERELASLSFKP